MPAVGLSLALAAAQSSAQTYTILHSFGTNVMGLFPHAPLVQGPDGSLYGTTLEGGRFDNLGQVFKVNADGSGYTVLKDFTGIDGANPEAGLVMLGTTLYGTTREGGANWLGTVFKLQTDGSGFAVLKEFSGEDGAYPQAGLVQSGTTLHGTTAQGGTNDSGTVFQISTDGTDHRIVHTFAESAWVDLGRTNADGAQPFGSLTLSGTTLYGTAQEGGTNGQGTVFKLNLDGSGFEVLRNFSTTDGAWPSGGLALSGTTLYGTTQSGGTNGHGVVFKLNTDGSGFAVVEHFQGSDGAFPYAGLLLSGTTLYGTTAYGGRSDGGTIFKFNTDGSEFTVVKEFAEDDGIGPSAGLILSGATLYGTASAGGINGFGTVFKVQTDGSDYRVLTQFAGGDGFGSSGALELLGSTLYGTTALGGTSGNGTIFKVNTDGSGHTVLENLDGWDGALPVAGLIVSGTNLYGTARYGGESWSDAYSGYGTVFKINTDGGDFTVLKRFTGSDGSEPTASLVLSDTTLYGTASAGGAGGTVFKLNTDGSGFTVLVDCREKGIDGPIGGLLLAGTTLYGTTYIGGRHNYGTVFRVNTDGSDFAVLHHFDFTDGGQPAGRLVQSGTTLYGTTQFESALFKVDIDGSNYTVMRRFPEGVYPDLILSGTTLYGTTSGFQGDGAVFEIGIDGSSYAVLKYFNGSDGSIPRAGLRLSGTTLYGTTESGGSLNRGVLFSLSPGPPTIALQPENQTVPAGSTAAFQVEAAGWPAPTYQWFIDETNALPGATNSRLELPNAQRTHAGGYSVVIANPHGSVTSLVATLTVQDPVIADQPRSQVISLGQTAVFKVVPGGTEPFSYQWRKEGVALAGATEAALTVPQVQTRDAGRYDVVVNNGYGAVTSHVATLTVNVALVDAFAPALDGSVNCLAETADQRIVLGGIFSQLDGHPHPGIARLNADGTPDHTFNPDLGGNARTVGLVVQPDRRILVVGSFTIQQGRTPKYICRITAGGDLDPAFNSDANAPITSVALQSDGKIIVGCYPDAFAAAPRTVVRLNDDGSVDTAFNAAPDAVVQAVALQPDGKVLIAGGFDNVNGQPRNRVARLNADGTLDSTFDPSPNPYPGLHGSAYAMALQRDGKVLVGGYPIFGDGDQVRAQLARLNPDGRLDPSFDAKVDSIADCITVQADGRILIGGGFSSVGGQTRYHIARLHADGTLDTTFDPGANGNVRALLPQSDGRILAGGDFTALGGAPRDHLGQLTVYEPPSFGLPLVSQTAEVGDSVTFSVKATGYPVLWYQFRLNGATEVGAGTNATLRLTNVELSQSGAYTAVVTNAFGAVTSSPALLNVIVPVPRRNVPGVFLSGDVGSFWQLESAASLGPPANWTVLAGVTLSQATQAYFDLTEPLPPRRFYRAWLPTTPGASPALAINLVPALTLTGDEGSHWRINAINRFGPVDAWASLAEVTLTNTTQLYFDVTAPGQPPRLYRLVPLP